MVGVIQRNETLRMLRHPKYLRRIVDLHRHIRRRMKHQQRLAHIRDALGDMLLGDVLQKLLANMKRTPGEQHFRLSLLFNHLQTVSELMRDMLGRRRRSHRRHRHRLRHFLRRRQHRRPAERMPDQYRRRLMVDAQILGGANQILHIRGEVGVGEVALARAQPGEVEAQHRDVPLGEGGGDAGGGENVLGAGEAVREQSISARRIVALLQTPGEALAGGAEEGDFLRAGGHGGVLHGFAGGRARHGR